MTTEHGDHHDDHDHGEFIAHHFESAEQQFDSGKLGIWVFLVTEILFFSGLFCAYTLYRYLNPEIYVQAHHYLDKVLGGGNTIVLLFSSLTMALAVRASQLGKNKTVAIMVLITMVCASIFLGVKAVEYSHKWDMGIFTRAYFHLDEGHHSEGVSVYLQVISVAPLILLGIFAAAAGLFKVTGKGIQAAFFGGLTIMVLGYFIGAVGGYVYMQATGGKSHESVIHSAGQDSSNHENAAAKGSAEEKHEHATEEHSESKPAAEENAAGEQDTSSKKPAEENHSAEGQSAEDHADEHDVARHPAGGKEPEELNHDIGIFFSIYYCMTGLHAFHVIGGIIALAWIFYRSLLGHWRSDYFGPVDYVGLYWHLVDLIWIFLFPLLYLIN